MVWAVLVALLVAAGTVWLGVHLRSPRVPPERISGDDLDLIRESDRAAWRKVRLGAYQGWKRQDDFYRVAAYKKAVETNGMAPAEAKAYVRRSFPFYYLDPSTRDDEGYVGVDASLPILLRDRVNKAAPVLKALIDEQTDLRTMNALVRKLIRKGVM